MIMITGSDGFIGKNLVEYFKNKGEELELVPDYGQFYFHKWREIKKIYHFGAISSTTCTDTEKLIKHNVSYTIELFQFANDYNIPVVYASSASVYGNQYSTHINPLNQYALSKAIVDQHLLDIIDKYQTNIVGLRIFNAYGKYEDHKGEQASVIHKFIRQAKDTGIIKIFKGSFRIYRDFICVDDIIKCALLDNTTGIYDIGTGRSESILEIAEAISNKYNAKIEEIDFPEHLKYKYQYYTRAILESPYKLDFTSPYLWIQKNDL